MDDESEVALAHHALGTEGERDDADVSEDTEDEVSVDAHETSRAFYEGERARRRAQRDAGVASAPEDDALTCEVEDEAPLRRRADTCLSEAEMEKRPRFDPIYHWEGDMERRTQQRSERRAASPGEAFTLLRDSAQADVRQQLIAEDFSLEAIEDGHESAVRREIELLRAERVVGSPVRWSGHE